MRVCHQVNSQDRRLEAVIPFRGSEVSRACIQGDGGQIHHIQDHGLRKGTAVNEQQTRNKRCHQEGEPNTGWGPSMTRKTLFALMAISAVVVLMISAYLTNLSSTPPTACPVGDHTVSSCTDIISSEYAYITVYATLAVAALVLSYMIIKKVRRHRS